MSFCFFQPLGLWSGDFSLIVPFPNLCLLLPFNILNSKILFNSFYFISFGPLRSVRIFRVLKFCMFTDIS